MVFLDGIKGDYPAHLELALPLLRSGGLVVVDNTLLSGLVAEGRADDGWYGAGDRDHAPCQLVAARALGYGGGAAAGRRRRAGRGAPVRKPVAAVLLVVALAAPSQAHALTRGTHVEVFKRGLNQVVDMAYVPRSTTLFYTEKTGAIRVIVEPQAADGAVRHPGRGQRRRARRPRAGARPRLPHQPLSVRLLHQTFAAREPRHALHGDQQPLHACPSPDHRDSRRWPATTTAANCSSCATGCS